MFTPIYLLPQADQDDRRKCRDRWHTPEGMNASRKILGMIRDGAGRGFLDSDFRNGHLALLEHADDLRGLRIFNENLTFPENSETFVGLDFSYSTFHHTTVTNASFTCTMSFTRFFNCTFKNCLFWFNNCYACTFENVRFVDCDFSEGNSFTNCSFMGTTFDNTFFPSRKFSNCKFDSMTLIASLPAKSVVKNVTLENKDLAELYRGFREAYYAGGATAKARHYHFLECQAETRHNCKTIPEKAKGLFVEYLMGYGLRPLRVLLCMFGYFGVVLIAFWSAIRFPDALLLTSGALFTFGAKADLLDSLTAGYRLLYIFTSFVGICFTALFVTVMANVLLREK